MLDETTLALWVYAVLHVNILHCRWTTWHVRFSLLCSKKDVISLFPLCTNSPVHSWTQSDPASAQSSRGSIPSVTGLVLLASDWPGRPSAGAARGSRAVLVHQPTWGTLLLWPQRRRWTALLAGCSTSSPGHPESKDHYSVQETAP